MGRSVSCPQAHSYVLCFQCGWTCPFFPSLSNINVYIYNIVTISFLPKSLDPVHTTAHMCSLLMIPRHTVEWHSPLADFTMTDIFLPCCFFPHLCFPSHPVFPCSMLLFFYAQQPLTTRSYFYLEMHPWTSEPKDPQPFSRFPNWLIISWILYNIHCCFHHRALFPDRLSVR